MPGIPFPSQVPDGNFYVGRGHTGGHCADGLTMNQKVKSNYQTEHLSGSCIMFGSGDMNSGTARKFCDVCVGYVKATELEDIAKAW